MCPSVHNFTFKQQTGGKPTGENIMPLQLSWFDLKCMKETNDKVHPHFQPAMHCGWITFHSPVVSVDWWLRIKVQSTCPGRIQNEYKAKS